MNPRLEAFLVYKDDPLNPLPVGRTGLATSPASSPTTERPALLRSDDRGHFLIEPPRRGSVLVNGSADLVHPLRDGDEIVAGAVTAIFRLAFPASDLESALSWDAVAVPDEPPLKPDIAKAFDTILLNAGLPRDALSEHSAEDYRVHPVTHRHFGFGRIRSLYLDGGLGFGVDHSRWEIVGAGSPTVVRQRLVSIGLPDSVVKWDLRKRSREIGEPFVTERLLVGWRQESARQRAHAALRAAFGPKTSFEPAATEAVWNLHHVDRIMSLSRF